MNYYLLIYDRRKGEILEHRAYPQSQRERAFADRLAEMIERRAQPNVEVVLFGAESYEDLAKTHSRYFKTADEIVSKTADELGRSADELARDATGAVRR